jgi:hypothetical protein
VDFIFQGGKEVCTCLYKDTDARFYMSLEINEGNNFFLMLQLVDSGATTSVADRRLNGMSFLKKNVKAQMFNGTEADIQITQDPTEIRFGPFTRKIWLTVCDKSCYDVVLRMDWINLSIDSICLTSWRFIMKDNLFVTTHLKSYDRTELVYSKLPEFFSEAMVLHKHTGFVLKLRLDKDIKDFRTSRLRKMSLEEEKEYAEVVCRL